MFIEEVTHEVLDADGNHLECLICSIWLDPSTDDDIERCRCEMHLEDE
jgi:hypothetical protein